MKTQSVLKTNIGGFDIMVNCNENGLIINISEKISAVKIETIKDFHMTSLNLSYLIVVLSFLFHSENTHWKKEIKELYEFCQEIDKELREIRGY